MNKEELVLEDGKYTFILEGGRTTILRYGEPWRDETGDKALGALFYQAREQQDLLKRLYERTKDLEDRQSDSCAWQSAELSELVAETKKLLGLK